MIQRRSQSMLRAPTGAGASCSGPAKRMRPARATTAPRSTTPRPGAPFAKVASRAFRQIVVSTLSAVMARTSPLGFGLSLMYRHNQVKREGRTMTTLHFGRALTADGWASNVRVRIDGATIASVERDAAAEAGDERCGIGVPAIANLHSHAFQRAMAGLDGTPRRGGGQLLDLARSDVPVRARRDSRRRRGDRRPGLCRDARSRLRRRRRVSLPSPRRFRRALQKPRRNGGADRRGRDRDGHRTDAASSVLCARGLWRRAGAPRAAPLRQRPRLLRRARR